MLYVKIASSYEWENCGGRACWAGNLSCCKCEFSWDLQIHCRRCSNAVDTFQRGKNGYVLPKMECRMSEEIKFPHGPWFAGQTMQWLRKNRLCINCTYEKSDPFLKIYAGLRYILYCNFPTYELDFHHLWKQHAKSPGTGENSPFGNQNTIMGNTRRRWWELGAQENRLARLI